MAVSEALRRAYHPGQPVAAMADFVGDAVKPLTVTSGGTTWRVGLPTQAAKARYEQLVFEREKDLVMRQKAFLPVADFQARCDALARQLEDRQFATGQPLWLKYASSGEGWVMWLQSLLAEHHPEVTFRQVVDLLKDKGDEVRLVLAAVVPNFFAWALDLATELAERLDQHSRSVLLAKLAEAREKVPEVLARWEHS